MAPRSNPDVFNSDDNRIKKTNEKSSSENEVSTSQESQQMKNNFVLNLTTVRMIVLCVGFVHLSVTAAVLLPIDMTQDVDPRIRVYQKLKWKFLTMWFNFIMLAYFPLCLYCDWREHKGDGQDRRVTLLRKIRDIVFTSILFPTTVFADIFFWRVFLKDPELISPVALFSYMPSWGQHSLHTVSLIMMFLDLLLTPRTKPNSVTARWALLSLFLTVYAIVVFISYCHGEMVYQMLGTLNGFQVCLLVVMIYIECLAYFLLQWPVIDYLWCRRKNAKQIE